MSSENAGAAAQGAQGAEFPVLPAEFGWLAEALAAAKTEQARVLVDPLAPVTEPIRAQEQAKVDAVQEQVDQVLAMVKSAADAESARAKAQRESDELRGQLSRQTPQSTPFAGGTPQDGVLQPACRIRSMSPYGGGVTFGGCVAVGMGQNLLGMFKNEQDVLRTAGQGRYDQAIAQSQSGSVQLQQWRGGGSAYQADGSAVAGSVAYFGHHWRAALQEPAGATRS